MNVLRYLSVLTHKAMFWERMDAKGENPIILAPTEYIQQISKLPTLANSQFCAINMYTENGFGKFNKWYYNSLCCRDGCFYIDCSVFMTLSLEHAQIYDEHYSQLSKTEEWAVLNDNGVYTLDKWTVTTTQLFYDGVPIRINADHC
jgi:hypothetical protein